MAIGPYQLTEKFSQDIDYFEKWIDEKLIKAKLAPGNTLSISPPPSMSDMHFKVLRERYISAGWSNVLFQSDQREGSWLEFESKK